MKRYVVKIIPVCLFLVIFGSLLYGNEEDLFRLAQTLYKNRQYFNAVTEIKRYQFLYPTGKYSGKSSLLLGYSYFKGNNRIMGIQILMNTYSEYKNDAIGEAALVSLIDMKIINGHPYTAIKKIREYEVNYKGGNGQERIRFNFCFATALTHDFTSALKSINGFKKQFPQSEYGSSLEELESLLYVEINKSEKSLAMSVLGSLVLPGFGHVYTGNYFLGIITFLTNALFGYLIFDGIRNKNTFQIVFFSLVEFSFYQYNIYGAIRSVREYNSYRDFNRRLGLTFDASF